MLFNSIFFGICKFYIVVKPYFKREALFTESAPRPIQSQSRDVREAWPAWLSVCLSVHIWKPSFPVDCRLLVKERITNIGIP